MVTKRLYGKEWEWSIGQIKTCRKKQHAEIDGKKEMSELICGKAAVGGNYNSTRDTLSVILQDKLREEASYGFECYFKEQLAEKKKGRNHDLSVTWRDCWRVWRRWLEKFIKK